MMRNPLVAVPFLLACFIAAPLHAGVAPAALKTPKEKTSYSVGVDMARSLQRADIGLDQAMLVKGFRDALSGGKLLLSEEDIKTNLGTLQTEMQQKRAVVAQKAGADNKKAGEAFLVENKAKPGVVTLPSGLQYKIIKEGTGRKPTATDTVECNYRGTLLDGTEFDSSYKRGAPASFPVNGVILGWQEALKLMPAGSKWQLFVPSQLAYGERSPNGLIGPNATLLFEVELLGIK